jgi:hypothetical protein
VLEADGSLIQETVFIYDARGFLVEERVSSGVDARRLVFRYPDSGAGLWTERMVFIDTSPGSSKLDISATPDAFLKLLAVERRSIDSRR